jgi:dTDP-4-dehydrorhamnose reductase
VTSARSVCEAIKIFIEKSTRGIYHLGGNERLSRFEMGELICDIYGFDKKYLKPSLQKDVKMPALRPRDVSLANNKMKSLGWNPGLFKDELELLKAEK